MRTIEGKLSAVNTRYVVVASRWNSFITERLVEGALDALRRHGADEDAITLVRVPGALEMPLAMKTALATGAYDAGVAIGCVIRGATPHFDFVAGGVASGIAGLSLATGFPIGFGVLTTDTAAQAIERAGGKAGNKGWEAATATIEMVTLLRALAPS